MLTKNKTILALLSSVFFFSVAEATDTDQIENAASTSIGAPQKELAPVLDVKNLEFSDNKQVFTFQTSSTPFREFSDIFEERVINWSSVYGGKIFTGGHNNFLQKESYSLKLKKMSSTNSDNFDRLFIKVSVDNEEPLAYLIDTSAEVVSVENLLNLKVYLADKTSLTLTRYDNISQKIKVTEEINVGSRVYKATPFVQVKTPLLETIKSTLPPKNIVGKRLYLLGHGSPIRQEWKILEWNCCEKDKNVFTLMQEVQPTALKQILPYRSGSDEQNEKDYVNYNARGLEGMPVVEYALQSSTYPGYMWHMLIKKGYAVATLFKDHYSPQTGFTDITFK